MTSSPNEAGVAARKKLKPFKVGSNLPQHRLGIQLYSVADQTSKIGFRKLLPRIAEIGFRELEFANYASGDNIGFKELKQVIEDCGLVALGNHGSMDDASLKAAVALGQEYTGLSVLTDLHGVTSDAWKQTADDLNAYGAKCAKEGVKFYIHMHGPEYVPVVDDPTKRSIDIMLEHTDPELVFWEMDIYWAYFFQSAVGGAGALYDPLDWVLANKHRFPLFHVKDGVKLAQPVGLSVMSSPFGAGPVEDGICDVGQGDIDFKSFFAKLAKIDALDNHHFIWERDTASDNSHGSMTSARASFLMMKYDHMAGESIY